jgi:hypothetical protein
MASKQQSKETAKETDNKQAKSEQQDSGKASSAKGNGKEGQTADLGGEVDELVEALNGDLSAIDAEGAMSLVNEWHDFLNKSKEPGVKELASGLKELQKLLKSGKADGAEIGEVLEKLGEQTSSFASEAEKGTKSTVQKLAKQLTQAGKTLGKADEQEHLGEIHGLVDTLDEDELTSVDPEAATGMIDTWYSLIQKQDGEEFQELADCLKELKQLLKKSKSKPEDIAEVLTRLGEQTAEVSSGAPRGFKTVVQKLGKQLSSAGKAMHSAADE